MAKTSPLNELIRKVRHADRQVRWDAIKELRSRKRFSEEDVPALIEALRDASFLVRSKAAETLGQIGFGARDAEPSLTTALYDECECVCLAAAEALVRLGLPSQTVVTRLILLLQHESHRPCQKAVEVLAGMGSSALEPLIAALSYSNSQIRRGAALALAKMGPAANAAVPALMKQLENERDAEWALVHAIAKIGPTPDDLPDLIIRAVDLIEPETYEEEIQQYAIDAVRQVGSAALPALRDAILCQGPDRQREGQMYAAINILRGMGSTAVPLLVEALDNTDCDFRGYAFDALKCLEDNLEEDERQFVESVGTNLFYEWDAKSSLEAYANWLDTVGQTKRSQAIRAISRGLKEEPSLGEDHTRD